MQLLTIDSREVAGRPGLLLPGGSILDLRAAESTLSQAQWRPHSVVSILVAGDEGRERLQALLDAIEDPQQRDRLQRAGAVLPFSGTALMTPLRRPGLMLVADSGLAGPGEPRPAAFIKSPGTGAAHGSTVRVPALPSARIHATAMAACVLGRPLYRAAEQAAEQAIAAWTLVIDISLEQPAERASAASWRRYLDSKQFPGAFPCGPALITSDEFSPGGQLAVRLAVNGISTVPAVLQLDAVPGLLAALSQRYGFRPGDLVAFADAAARSDPTRPLRAADQLSVSLDERMQLSVTLAQRRSG